MYPVYTQLFVSFLPLLIAASVLMAVFKARAVHAAFGAQHDPHAVPAPAVPVPAPLAPLPPVPPEHALQLRFLHGEQAALPHVCDRRMRISELKAQLLPRLVGAAHAPTATPVRAMLIAQGALLRDNDTVAECNLQPDTVVHVHIHQEQPQQQQAQQQAQAAPRAWHQYPGAAPAHQQRGGAHLLFAPQPVRVVLQGGQGAQQVAQPGLLMRGLSAIAVGTLGALWGTMLVFGSSLFDIDGLLMLMAATAMMCLGISRLLV